MNAPIRCEMTDLPADQCAHCLGHDRTATPARMNRADRFRLAVDEVMDLMGTARLTKAAPESAGHLRPIGYFNNVEPMHEAEVTHADYGDKIYRDVWPGDLASPLDVCVATFMDDAGPQAGNLVIHRYRKVRKVEVPVRFMARHVVEVSRAWIEPGTKEGKTALLYWGMNSPDPTTWLDLRLGVPMRETEPGMSEVLACQLSMGLFFGRDYHWHVSLKRPGAKAGVLLPTTAAGARELFKLRDCEPGESRRRALRHWVSGHSRRIRKDTPQEDLTWVRDHLRGRSTFKWEDMEGEIRPSGFDLRQLAKARKS